MRLAQLLLGRIGFDPASVLDMTEAEIMSHVTNLMPKTKSGSTRKIVNEAWRRRKHKQEKDA